MRISAIAAALVVLTGAGAWAADSVHLRGSDSLAPLARQVAEAYMAEHPDAAISIVENTTGRGLKAVLDGTAHGALVSSAIPEDLERRAKDAGMTLSYTAVGYDGIVPVVHRDNPVSNLDLTQLRAIFTGAVTDWSQLGAPPGRIRIYATEPLSGTAVTWRMRVIGPLALQSPTAIVVETTRMVAKVAADRNAIGYVAGLRCDSAVKALAVNGIHAGPDTLRSGRYPLTRELAVVTATPPPPATAAFLAFFLAADKGQRVVAASGGVPLRAEGGS